MDQEFNSLDNQRGASEAYIGSLAREGWKLIGDHYDDGVFSAGSIDQGRLPTSPSSSSCSTKFAREITGERIRDKVAASEKRGIWTDGTVPFGYRAENRALHVLEDHAEFVRDLFKRYLDVGSVVRLKAALDAENVRLPVRIVGTGRAMGGGLISRGHIYHMLSNPIRVGRLRHEGRPTSVYTQQSSTKRPGSVSNASSWTESNQGQSPTAMPNPFLQGNRIGPSHAAKSGRHWRHSVSRALLKGRKSVEGRLPRGFTAK